MGHLNGSETLTQLSRYLNQKKGQLRQHSWIKNSQGRWHDEMIDVLKSDLREIEDEIERRTGEKPVDESL